MKLDKLLNASNIDIQTKIYSILPDFSHSVEKRVLNIASENVEAESKDSDNNNSVLKYNKIQDSYLECLKRYIEEDKYTSTKKAMKRLREEAGLDVSLRLVHRSLIKLREELGPEYSNLSIPPVVIKRPKDRTKLMNIVMENIERYFNENRFIGPTEAMKRLQLEAGLDMSFSTVRAALLKLRKEAKIDGDDLPLSFSKPKKEKVKREFSYKLKELHIEHLKKYLKEDSFIGATKVKNRLRDDTGLEVSTQTIKKILIKLKKVIEPEYVNLDSSTVRNTQLSGRYKLKDTHLEFLKKCLKENNSIGANKAKDLLRKETGMQVSVCPVQKALVMLRKEINDERNGLPISPPSSSSREQDFGYKLKDSHIERLKRYLKEEKYMSSSKAIRKLREETGLKVSIPTVKRALIRLRKEMNIEIDSMDPASVKALRINGRTILNDYHKVYLRRYLKENKYIIAKDAYKRLQEETGINVSCVTVYRALAKLRIEMGPEYVHLDLSIARSKHAGDRIKIKDKHLELLTQLLKDDKYLTAGNARKRLIEETGLKVSVPTVHKTLLKLKEEMDPEYAKMYSSASVNMRNINRFKLKDNHLAVLKKHIKEDRRFGPTKAKSLLKEEFDLEMSIPTIRNAFANLRKEINQERYRISLSTSKVNSSKNLYFGYRLKYQHIEFLKECLIENRYIRVADAQKKLLQEMGIKVSLTCIRIALLSIKKIMDSDK